jgi:ADP-ribose pyrophosphatase YjhB (NUDIX family)
MGFPHLTVELPAHRPRLEDVVDNIFADPFGQLRAFRDACRSGPQPRGHLCVTNWVIDVAHASALLVWHRAFGWATCGGHVQLDEDPETAAWRELYEETRLDATCVHASRRPLFVHRSEPGPDLSHVHWNIAYGWATDELPPVVGEAGAPAAWFRLDALPPDRPADVDAGLAVLLGVLGADRA